MLPDPSHAPGAAVSVKVRCDVPVIAGGVVLAGGSHTTGPTGSLVAEACPKALVAVTVTRMRAPRSAVVSV